MVEPAVISSDINNDTTNKIIELRVDLPQFQRTLDDRGNEVVYYMVHVTLGCRNWTL